MSCIKLLFCVFTGTGLSLKLGFARMRSTTQSSISLTLMTPTMPTTVTRLMNLKRARRRNPLQQCPRLCSRPCSKPNSFLKRYDWFLAYSSLGLRYLAGFSIATSIFCFQQVQSQVIQETVVPKEPPPEFEFIADPPSISAFDLDVVKLTAQFVARNGRQFLTQLMQKEQRNYQFDFLRPQHSLFNYFTKLVEQYTKVS